MPRSFLRPVDVWCAGCLWVAAVAGVVWSQTPPVEVLPPSLEVPAATSPEARALAASSFIGVSSCAASSCHGGTKIDRGYLKADPLPWRSAYIVWATEDRHSRAYQVLQGEPAKQILRKLDRLPSTDEAHPHEDRRCLSCHATFEASAEVAELRKSPLLTDGVSCESCHGAAEKWVGIHFLRGRQESEEAFRARRLERGMTDTDDPVVRAETCVGCHVGRREPGDVRDMNHDMIAAGHPTLNFEFAAYLARMPRHWRLPHDDLQFVEGDTRRRTATNDDAHRQQAEHEYESWAVGRRVTAAAFLKLSAGRADAAQESHGVAAAPWPEFSGFDCYRCHHALRGEASGDIGALQNAALARMHTSELPVGRELWETWGARYLPPSQRGALGATDDELSALARQLWNPAIDDADLQSLASRLRRDFADKLEAAARNSAMSVDPDAVADEMRALAAEGAAGAISWDRAAQAYLGCVALHRARHAAAGRPLDAADDAEARTLKELLAKLRFEPVEQRTFNSPADYDPAAVRLLFETLSSAEK